MSDLPRAATAPISSGNPLFCQSARRKAVTKWTPWRLRWAVVDALTSVSNHPRDSPGGSTAAGKPRESAPAVKLLTAMTRTSRRRIRRSSTHHRGRTCAPHTSLPWHTTDMPDTVRSRARSDATGSSARCPRTKRAGTTLARSQSRASAKSRACAAAPAQRRSIRP